VGNTSTERVARFSNEPTALQKFGWRIENIAASLRIELRSTKDRTYAKGTAWSTEPSIEVTVVWLLLPVLKYLAITVFSFATVLRAKDPPPWKSSAVALLKSIDPDKEMREMEKFRNYAKSISIRLENKRKNWYLLERHGGEASKIDRREEDSA
jgi:hypothetical protein